MVGRRERLPRGGTRNLRRIAACDERYIYLHENRKQIKHMYDIGKYTTDGSYGSIAIMIIIMMILIISDQDHHLITRHISTDNQSPTNTHDHPLPLPM